ncbi:hypothetical protein CEXT_201151 [Caerostris extrusa]|uniref:Uncharacterized protein n=1 Tax=Caerostris extrusa TaxID=172846 RepID=A0AAV4PQ67_CAEEX|nr:hypothetical protein CEXT_201151 [Caerostris extrusa]
MNDKSRETDKRSFFLYRLLNSTEQQGCRKRMEQEMLNVRIKIFFGSCMHRYNPEFANRYSYVLDGTKTAPNVRGPFPFSFLKRHAAGDLDRQKVSPPSPTPSPEDWLRLSFAGEGNTPVDGKENKKRNRSVSFLERMINIPEMSAVKF